MIPDKHSISLQGHKLIIFIQSDSQWSQLKELYAYTIIDKTISSADLVPTNSCL